MLLICVVIYVAKMLLLISMLWKRLMLVSFEHVVNDVDVAASCLPLVGFEADLEDSVAESVAVKGLDGDQGLVVVGHRHEAEPLALVGLQVTDHLKC